MFIHNKIILFISVIYITMFIGCATSYAPDNYLPETSDIPQNIYGGWITLITSPDSSMPDDKWMMYGGELIAVVDSFIYLMYDSIYQIPKYKITESILELDLKNTTSYGLWVLGGSLLTISNGYYASITFPLWLGAGIPAFTGESARDRYEIEYPDENYWMQVKLFARFPQGINNIQLSKIKPLFE